MGKKKIIIDTNIFISALGWGGKSRLLLKKVINNEYELFLSQKQLNEIKKVLDYPKLSFTQEQKTRFIEILERNAIVIKTEKHITKARDIKDNIILEAGVEAQADYIITGDNDLLDLKEYDTIKILTVDDFLNIV